MAKNMGEQSDMLIALIGEEVTLKYFIIFGKM